MALNKEILRKLYLILQTIFACYNHFVFRGNVSKGIVTMRSSQCMHFPRDLDFTIFKTVHVFPSNFRPSGKVSPATLLNQHDILANFKRYI